MTTAFEQMCRCEHPEDRFPNVPTQGTCYLCVVLSSDAEAQVEIERLEALLDTFAGCCDCRFFHGEPLVECSYHERLRVGRREEKRE